MRTVLLFLSYLYRLGLYLFKITTAKKKVNAGVISVGNITTGGTGKTPVVLKILETLDKECLKAVLTRGYGRKTTGIYIASPKSSFIEIGDEAVIMQRRFPELMIVAGANRYESARVAVNNSARILILDDGFQSYELERDIDIVLIDCTRPFGGGHVLPAGTLREPLSSLSRADCVILNRSNMVKENELVKIKGSIKKYNSNVSIFHAYEKIKYFREISGERRRSLEDFKNKRILCFSAIGNQAGFYNLLEKSSFTIIKKFERQDHHVWTEKELKMIVEEADKNSFEIVTTEKDAARLPQDFIINGWILIMDINIAEHEKWKRFINEIKR